MRVSLCTTLFCICLVLLSTAGLHATQPFWSMEPSTREISRADSLTGFDVIKYTIDLAINEQTHYVNGSVEAIVLAEENLSSLSYRLEGGTLAVTAVQVNGISAAFTHQDGLVTIPMNIAQGQQFTTKVWYSGVTGNSPTPYNIGLIYTANGCYTLSNPDAGRYWWPSYDHPWDKALVDWHITVRSDWLAAANGLRTGITDNGDGTRTHHWVSSSPIATYVVGFAAGPYVEFTQNAGTLPIQNFVMPGQLNAAQADFANVPQMISHFSELFGPYPFEKYGHMVVNMATYAAMEHQTMTTFGSQYINGQQTYESIVAHELAHQWYGNYLTPITMREVWLKESFATYSEMLWTHKKSGWDAACNYLRTSIQNYYITWENNNGPHTIYNPEYNLMFAPPTYEKSASVLHMLRLKLGNDAFFPFIRALLTSYPNGNINTAEFIALAEQYHGSSLTQFFQQWIYSPGIPNVSVALFSNADNLVKSYGYTTSPTATQFFVDVPLRLTGSAMADSVVVVAGPSGGVSLFQIGAQDAAEEIELDPNHWVLTRQMLMLRQNLASCLPYNGAVALTWQTFPASMPLAGYHVYRRILPDGNVQRITPQPLNTLSYTDITVTNGTTYEYYVVAVDTSLYESLPSNRMTAMPIDFPFDQGFLVVDETRNGNGTAISPSNAQVDAFYQDVLQGFIYSEWDYATQGAPALADLSHYPLVLWHCDDFSEQQLVNNLDLIGSYVLSGGRLMISGWKYPAAFSDSFIQQFLPGITLNYHNGAVFISAQSDIYPDLWPDPDKLVAPWNGMLTMTYTFSGAQSALYTAEISGGGVGHGAPAAIRMEHGGSLVLLGFPLYFMQQEGVRSFLSQYLPELYPALDGDDPIAPALQPLRVKVSPNPLRFGESLKLTLSGLDSHLPLMISLYNLRGQLLRQNNLSEIGSSKANYPLDVSTLPSGIYLCRVGQGSKQHTVRLSIVR